MNKLSFYRLLSLILLLVNIGLLTFMFFNRPPRGSGRTYRQNHERLFTRLGFGDAEQAAFEVSKEKHRLGMQELTRNKSELLRTYFDGLLLESSADSVQQNELLARIDSIESTRIQLTYQHFEEVRALVPPANEVAYSTFVKDALQNILLPAKRKKGRRK